MIKYFSGKTHKLSTLKMILSTGSPLVPRNYDYVYRDVKKDLLLGSISGMYSAVPCNTMFWVNGNGLCYK